MEGWTEVLLGPADELNKKPANWLSETKRRATKILHKAVGSGIFDSFFCDNFWSEVASDVKAATIVDYGDIDIRVKYGDSGSNRPRDIRVAHFVMDNDERHPT